MQGNKGIGSLFPGSVATNSVVLTLGVILSVCSFLPGISGIVASLIAGLGASMFLAGFLGLINVRVLANEVRKVTSQPFEDIALLYQIRGSGMEGMFRERADVLREKIIPALEEETSEIVIVGSSLKGLIGIGYGAVGQDQRIS